MGFMHKKVTWAAAVARKVVLARWVGGRPGDRRLGAEWEGYSSGSHLFWASLSQ